MKTDPRNARKHPERQLAALTAGIRAFGFLVPLIVDEKGVIIAGHARLIAGQRLAIDLLPCVRVTTLSPAQKTALAIADNRLSELAEWDPDALRDAIQSLGELDFSVELTGFNTAEVDIMLDMTVVDSAGAVDPADAFGQPDRSLPAVTVLGDTWALDVHRLHCGDALTGQAYQAALGKNLAAMVITDPPYNVPIQGHVSGLGKTRHREFAMASGEMSSEQFVEFLASSLTHMARFSVDGSLHFVFMDWRGMRELMEAGAGIYGKLNALCVWNKTNGGMGSFYRSKHELVFIYKHGNKPHQNNIQLGKFGRYRTNVWDYPGVNTFGRGRQEALESHPTVKPVAMIADAIRDCSKRGDVILDPVCRIGTLLLAAERTGRRAAAIELDPHYVDGAVQRWQRRNGKVARLLETGETFDEAATRRSSEGHANDGAASDD